MRPLEDIRILSLEQYGAGPFGSLHLADLGRRGDQDRGSRPRGRRRPLRAAVSPRARTRSSSRPSTATSAPSRSTSTTLRARGVFEDLVRGLRRRLLEPARRRAGEDRDHATTTSPTSTRAIVCCSLSGFGMTGPRVEPSPATTTSCRGSPAGWTSPVSPTARRRRAASRSSTTRAGSSPALAILAGVHAARRDGVGMDCDVEPVRHGDRPAQLPRPPGTSPAASSRSGPATRRTPRSCRSRTSRPPTAGSWSAAPRRSSGGGWPPSSAATGWRRTSASPASPCAGRTRPSCWRSSRRRSRRARRRSGSPSCGPPASPVRPVNTVAEALADEHTLRRRMIVTTEHPRFGEVRQVASPVRVGDAEPSYRRAPSPRRGHATHVLGELLGYDAGRISELRSRGARSARSPGPGAGGPTASARPRRVVGRARPLPASRPRFATAVCLHALDGIGCALAAGALGAAEPALAVARRLGGEPEARWIGSARRASRLRRRRWRAASSSTPSTSTTLTRARSSTPSAAVLPGALAVAEETGADGGRLLEALVGRVRDRRPARDGRPARLPRPRPPRHARCAG